MEFMSLMRSRHWATLLAALAVWTLFSGCAGSEIRDSDPAALFGDAEKDIENSRYQLATDKLRMIRNKFPYSKYSVDAQLKMADVYFMQESYGEAAIAYETFRDLHPKHERVAYAMFRIGKSHFNDIPSPLSRDLTPAQKSISAYGDFLQRFPNSPDAEEAKKDLTEATRQLSEKEFYIANFYWREKNWEAAKNRYLKLIAQYPDTEAAKKSSERVAQIDRKLESAKADAEKK
jgi:outer membrane protein assembly factor BamD